MNTPIVDFVRDYAGSSPSRLHMPGHKGQSVIGPEVYDITEIEGAGCLYGDGGIIAQSEANASLLFGCPTRYSAEGSSLAIRAMLYLVCVAAAEQGRQPLVLAGRNCHKTFLYAASHLGFDVEWLTAKTQTYLSCPVTPSDVEQKIAFMPKKPDAVYLTSPDYLGGMADVKGIAEVCRRHGVLLLVDNAHGAYLKFLKKSLHPIDLGADMCCDSAHKTLPVLTGGAYLHISPNAPAMLSELSREALAMFGSTSPSYLILQSLDMANKLLSQDGGGIANTVSRVSAVKANLAEKGVELYGDEPMKLTVRAEGLGMSGMQLADYLDKRNIICEFADRDFTVMMPSASTTPDELEALCQAITAARENGVQTIKPPSPPVCLLPPRRLSVREAMLAPSELLCVDDCLGRVLALPCGSCPPAVQIVACGEVIDQNALAALHYYKITHCRVVKKSYYGG